MNLRANTRGFTIVELMIATSVFSLLLLISMAALIFIGRIYYKGTTESRTTNTASSIIDEVSSSVKFSGQDVKVAAGPNTGWDGAYCIGSTKYSYKLNKILEIDRSENSLRAQRVLVKSQDPLCLGNPTGIPLDPPATFTALGSQTPEGNLQELLAEYMRLTRFEVVGSPEGLTTINISVVYGGDSDNAAVDTDIYNYESGQISSCKTGVASSQFCSVKNLSTTVLRKVN